MAAATGKAAPLRILGIDPGSRVTGYGVVEKVGHDLRFVSCGAIRVAPGRPLAERLKEIHDGIGEVITSLRPDVAAVEEIFVAANPRSALTLGHARGVLLLAAIQHGLAVHEYPARVVKQAVAGSGRAPKAQVQHMVRVFLALAGAPSEDAADALAVALCHANHCNGLPGVVS